MFTFPKHVFVVHVKSDLLYILNIWMLTFPKCVFLRSGWSGGQRSLCLPSVQWKNCSQCLSQARILGRNWRKIWIDIIIGNLSRKLFTRFSVTGLIMHPLWMFQGRFSRFWTFPLKVELKTSQTWLIESVQLNLNRNLLILILCSYKINLNLLLLSLFSYASSSTLYPCQ